MPMGEFVADLLVEPDPDLLPLRDLGEGRLLWMSQRDRAKRPGPLDRAPGRDYAQLKASIIRLRLRESLESAEYLADIRCQHA